MTDIVRKRRGQTIRITLRPGETEADYADEIQRHFDRADSLVAEGVTEYHSQYFWRGPLKVMVSKEVGPPPWTWPKIKFNFPTPTIPMLSGGIGWRSTLYSIHVLWAGLHQPHPRGGGQHDYKRLTNS